MCSYRSCTSRFGLFLQPLVLSFRSEEFEDLEIVVLRHELAVVRRRVGRPHVRPADRAFLAAASRLLRRARWLSFLRDAGTLVRWHRDLVRRRSTQPGRRSGRPELAPDVRELGLRLAPENPRWGDQRIVGELGGLGLRVSATSVRKIPRRAGPGPASGPAGPSWREFLGTHAQTMIACDFFTVDALWPGRLCVLFLIELAGRRVHLAGCTAGPGGEWVAQQARKLCWSPQQRRTPLRFLIRDRDSKFTLASTRSSEPRDYRSSGRRSARRRRTPSPERCVRTVRVEWLDWLPIAGAHSNVRSARSSTTTTPTPAPRARPHTPAAGSNAAPPCLRGHR